jgi:hypothetical protein
MELKDKAIGWLPAGDLGTKDTSQTMWPGSAL